MSDKWVDGNDGWAYYNEMIGVNGHTEKFPNFKFTLKK